jgi:hypothetical protein
MKREGIMTAGFGEFRETVMDDESEPGPDPHS